MKLFTVPKYAHWLEKTRIIHTAFVTQKSGRPKFEQFKTSLSHFRKDWAILTTSGRVWKIFRQVWTIQDKFERFQTSLNNSRQVWTSIKNNFYEYLVASRKVNIDLICWSFSWTSCWLSSPPNFGVSCKALAKFSTPPIPLVSLSISDLTTRKNLQWFAVKYRMNSKMRQF